MRDAGLVEGRDFTLEYRDGKGDAGLLRQQAEELVRLDVHVINALGTPATIAAQAATRRIPIVMAVAADPVKAGFVASFAQPGGNITGYYSNPIELEGKRLDVIREVMPHATRVGVLFEPGSAYWALMREDRDRMYRAAGMEPVYIAVATAADIEAAITEAHRQRVEVLMIPRDGFWYLNRDTTIAAAARPKLPIMAADDGLVAAGALLSLAPDETEGDRALTSFLVRILRGARPADLPVQQPTKYELLSNLKTAKALGLSVPPTLVARADEVIE